MPTMNETSTITLPEYHNLLALLLLNLNTPSVSSTTQEEEMIEKRKKRDNAHTEPGARHQNRTSRQASYLEKETDLTHKTRYQKERQTKPVYHHEHANTNHTPERRITPNITQPTQNPKTKKKNRTTHSRAHPPPAPRDSSRHRPTSNHPVLHPSPRSRPHHLRNCHTLNYTLIPSPDHILPAATSPTACLYYALPLYHHRLPATCTQLYPCLSRSRYRSPSTCVPLPVGRYGPPPPGYHMLTCILLLSHCCLHTVHMSVCTTVLVCYSTMPTVLGSATVLTTLHRPHPLRVTPAACATTSPLRESTHTPCRFHHPYRSLTLAHRVVPPLVVPVPSLAVSGVRLSCVVPLAGESPLADARLRLTPMVTCCSLTLAHTLPSIHAHCFCHHSLLAHMLTVLYPRLLTYLPSFLSTSLLATFIQSCQHDAASIVHQIRQSPKPPQCNHT